VNEKTITYKAKVTKISQFFEYFHSLFAHALHVWRVIPTSVLAASAAGFSFGADVSPKTHRAILHHAVLVRDDRRLKQAWVLLLLASTHMRRRLRTPE
jgi:hypothetical protein